MRTVRLIPIARFTIAAALLPPLAASSAQQASANQLTVDRIFASRDFASEGFGPAAWLSDGRGYTTVEPSKELPGSSDLVRYDAESGTRSVLVPAARLIPSGATSPLDLEDYTWSADGKRLLIAGSEPGHGVRLYVQDLSGGKPRPITPEGISIRGQAVSPDGGTIFCRNPEGKYLLYSADGGEPRPIPGLGPEESPSQWGPDGRSLYVYRPGELPAVVYRLDFSTGRKELWRQFMPADPAGIGGIGRTIATPDRKSYVYSYARILSELYVVEGLK